MKQTQAAIRGSSGAGRDISGRVKALGRRILDKVFLRSKIWETRNEVRDLHRAVPALERDLDVSVTLLSKKLDYLVAKIDAYADVDDANHAAILKAFGERQEALAARFEAIERRGADIAAALDVLRVSGEEDARRRGEELAAGLAAIHEGVARHSEVETAFREEVRSRSDALAVRFEAIERSGADIAAALDVLRVSGEEDARRGEELAAGLAAIDEGMARRAEVETAFREEVRSRYDALAARFEAIERRGADIAAALDVLQVTGEENARRGEELAAGLAAIDEGVARRSEVETAFREEVRSRYDALASRLAVIEMGNAALTERLEAMRLAEKEIGEAVTNSGRDLVARIEAGQAKLGAIEAAQSGSVARIEKSVEKIAFNEFQQLEALDALRQLLKFDLPLPATRGWAASPDFLLYLYQHITTNRPKVVVELGSGVSTLVAAAALAANGDDGRLHSLDHDKAYAEATSALLLRHDFSHIATVHHAPLGSWQPSRPTELGKEWQWYCVPEVVNDLSAVDLLVVDGPPKATGPFGRYPAVPHFRSRMAADCTVLLDDARRPDEKKAAEAWSRENGFQLRLLEQDAGFEKGLAILTTGETTGATL